MATEVNGELYNKDLIGILERVWGKGWLSPGGPEEVSRLLDGLDLRGKSVLDIGCGAGGVEIELIKTHGAGYVTGIDVEDSVLAAARRYADEAGIAARCGFVKVAPGSLPFPPQTFDVVFSKDSIVHIPDKHALMREVFRILKPGGWFVASDWLIGHDNEPSDLMKAYIASEGLNFGMASPARYREALATAGMTEIALNSRNAWYRLQAREELERLQGPLYAEAAAALGSTIVDINIGIWRKMIPVLDAGEHAPTHIRGRRPLV